MAKPSKKAEALKDLGSNPEVEPKADDVKKETKPSKAKPKADPMSDLRKFDKFK